MIFLGASTEPTMFVMLTEADVNNMRAGRTMFVDKTVTKGFKFDKVVLSVHKNQTEIENQLRKAGHGKLLDGQQSLPSPVPEPGQEKCEGCGGIMPPYLLYDKQCIVCWRETARRVVQ